MSFIRLFFIFVVLSFLFGVIGFFGGREFVLYWASQGVARAGQQITRPTTWKNYVTGCPTEITSQGPAFSGFQLRFIDQVTYALEVRCQGADSVLRAEYQLPWGVKKTTGSAGFYYDYEPQTLNGEVTLEFWGQTKSIVTEGSDTFRQTWGKSNYQASLPASACVAHGFQCCSATEEVGQGSQQLYGVTDCPDTCYSQCLQRPVALSFQTNPAVDHENRQILIPGTSTLVLFAYAFDQIESPIKEVVVDFGDGQQASFSTPNQEFSHEYECRQTTLCIFPVTVRAIDQRGIESAVTRLTTAIIQLDPNSQAVLY